MSAPPLRKLEDIEHHARELTVPLRSCDVLQLQDDALALVAEVRRLQKENDRLLLKLAATQHIDYEVEG